jgi:hypothetical protein
MSFYEISKYTFTQKKLKKNIISCKEIITTDEWAENKVET